MTEAPFSDLLPSGWHLTHLILLDPEWQANITDEIHVAVATGTTIEEAILYAGQNATLGVFAGKLFHLPRAEAELIITTPYLTALGLVERPIHRRKV